MSFDCPYCGQNLDADADLGGTMLNCPTCKNDIIVPVDSKNVGSGAGMKMCPFCSEPIKAAAVKCKHCGSMLDGVSSLSKRYSQEPPRPMPTSMASINCLECGRQMSGTASQCPHCGANKWQSVGYTVAQKFGLVVLFLIGGVVATVGISYGDEVVKFVGFGISACSIGFMFGRTRK